MRRFPPQQPNQPSKIARPQPPIPGKSTNIGNTGNESKTSPVITNNNINSNAIDTISNKLREGIDEMITNLTIVSNKTIELEKRNTELQTKVEKTNQLKEDRKSTLNSSH